MFFEKNHKKGGIYIIWNVPICVAGEYRLINRNF